MKSLIKKLLREGLEDTYWDANGSKTTLSELLDATTDIPVKDIPVEDVRSHIIPSEDLVRIDKSNLKYPILVFTDTNGNVISVIDGNHRLQKAINNKLDTIKGKMIPVNSLPPNIKKTFDHMLNESSGSENLSHITQRIPYDKLILDKENLQVAINNLKGKKPSMSVGSPMQVARSEGGKYYLIDGYHRFVAAILQNKTDEKMLWANATMEELKKNNKIGIGCTGEWKPHMTTYDEHCSNFKNIGTIDMIKQAFSK